jgi:arylsulfatase A-like enzyme
MKYNFLNKISSGLLLSSVTVGATAQTTGNPKQSPENATPNVIYIIADDLGFSDIETYGNQHISTPNINKLAKSGMSFTQFYSGTSVSAPSRASLMTGQHTGHTKIRGNKELNPEGQEPLDPTVKTIAQLFKTAGYATGAFGKWGLGYPGSVGEPTRMGFDKFYGYNCQRQAHSYYPAWLYNNTTKVILDSKTYSQDLIHQQMLQFIRENKDKPFFGYFAYSLPHASLEQPNDSILKMYDGKFCEPKTYTYNGDYAGTTKPRAQFAGMVTRLDTYVGQVIAELEKQGILNNTILIFTSDNGPHTEGGADPDFFNTEKLLKGTKRSLYEGGMRVPFIASWNGHIAPGTTNNHQAAFWDMMPTFNDLLGQQTSWTQATDGVSMLPTLTGQGTQAEHDYLYWEFHEQGGRQCVRKGAWVLIRQNISTTPTLELYNLEDDLIESTQLSAKYPEKVKELVTIMDNAHVNSTIFNFGK